MSLANIEPCLSRLFHSFQGPPVPYVRMTKRALWTPEAKNYLGYKKSLADSLREAHPEWIVGPGPDTQKEKAARKKWVAEQKRYVYELWVTSYQEELLKGDADNTGKTASDALEYAQILYNDTLVIDTHYSKREDKQNPRLEITLERVLR